MTKRIVITAGGTGGHVYPALALGQRLAEKLPRENLLFVGGKLAQDFYLQESGFACKSVSCAHFAQKNPGKLLASLFRIGQGFWQSQTILRSFRPDAIVGFGSYYTLPLLLAAKSRGVPFLLHEANCIPGKVNRLLAPYAKATAIHFPETALLLRGKTIETGMPLRKGYALGSISSEEARAYFGLQPQRKTALIFGGSQGAQALNALLQESSSALWADWQLIHLAGSEEAATSMRRTYAQKGIWACVKSFETRMDLAWQAADRAICRAGAGTIAELIEFEVPALLIPYPYATDNHQEKNGDFVAKTVIGGKKEREKDLTPQRLKEIWERWSDAEEREMKQAISDYKRRARGHDLASLVLNL